MTKKRWIDRFVKQFTRRLGQDSKVLGKEFGEVSYQEYGNPESNSYDKDYTPEDSADDEYYAMCSDA